MWFTPIGCYINCWARKTEEWVRNCRERVRPINARSGVPEYLRRLHGRASWTRSDLRSSGWEACATRIITLTSEVDEQNTEHSVRYENTGFLFVQNIIAISPTWLFPFTGRQVTRARNHIALCSAGGFANSAEFQKPQTAHFLFCHDHLLQTISVLVASSHCRPSLF